MDAVLDRCLNLTYQRTAVKNFLDVGLPRACHQSSVAGLAGGAQEAWSRSTESMRT